MTIDPAADHVRLKDMGNDAYKKGEYDLALDAYTRALDTSKEDKIRDEELAILYKNRAQVLLKNEDFQSAVADCTKCLELVPNDPKALYRRSLAYEGLGQIDSAYNDARQVHKVDPKNKDIEPVLVRLHRAVQQKVTEMAQTANKVKSMFDLVFDPSKESEKRRKAADNLVYLAKDKAGAENLFKEGSVQQIAKLMKIEKDHNIRLSLIRCIGEISKKNREYVLAILTNCGVPFFLDILNSNDEETLNASSYVIQLILDSLSDANVMKKVKELRKNPRMMTSDERKWCNKVENERFDLIKNSKEITSIFNVLTSNCTSRMLTGEARDAIIGLIMKNCKVDELGWAEKMLRTDAYERLMEVASEMTEYKHESSMEITDDTRTVVGVCMAFCYEAMYDDKRRNAICDHVDKFIQDKLLDPSMESKVRCTVAITTLLKNAVELGMGQISKDGVIPMMLEMAKSDNYVMQVAAAEALIAATAKKKDSSTILQQGIDVLKQLYKSSKNDHIKVRALVGMCKLGASSGHDASLRPFADGSTEKLAEACRRFLVNPGKDRDLRKWAAEGLSFLSLDADVKEKLVDDEAAIKALIELAKEGKQDCMYGIITLLVNLTNSYEKQEIMPEMIELAKFAKHHIPQEHELDDPDFVDKRVFTLANSGITYALVALSKTESKNIKELISRVLNAICKNPELRGLVVQQGGSKALCSMALDGNEKGMRQASQALARIGITQDPSIAFPGQRAVDIVRPICQLLNVEYDGLENFEALMCLGNLASLNDSTRNRILKESDFVTQIESYMFEDHIMIRRAAVQCFTNLCVSPLHVKRCEGKNDKIKFCVLLCGDDSDIEVVRAAAGALAMLTSQSEKCCRKVFDSIQWNECLLNLLSNPDLDIVLRGVVIVKNMITAGKDIAEKLIETHIMECLQAHIFKAKLDEGSYKPDEQLKKVRDAAEETLNIAHSMKIIKTQKELDDNPQSDED